MSGDMWGMKKNLVGWDCWGDYTTQVFFFGIIINQYKNQPQEGAREPSYKVVK